MTDVPRVQFDPDGHGMLDAFPVEYTTSHRCAFQGTLIYQGTVLSDALQLQVLLKVLPPAGLAGADQQALAPVRVKHAATAALSIGISIWGPQG